MAIEPYLTLLFLVSFIGASTAQTRYDFFVLAQQWPPSLCNVGRRCAPPIKQDFTVHGLWPNLYSGAPLQYCTNTRFDPVLLNRNNQRSRLTSQWPNVYNPRQSQSFWKYEWDKHGTCSVSRFGQYDYFELALRLKNQYSLKAALAASGILPGPGKTYALSAIKNAIRTRTGQSAAVVCNGSPPRSQLQEIRMCANPVGQFIACPASVRDNCNQVIAFPS